MDDLLDVLEEKKNTKLELDRKLDEDGLSMKELLTLKGERISVFTEITKIISLYNRYNDTIKVLEILSNNTSNEYQKVLRYIFNNWTSIELDKGESNLHNEISKSDESNFVDSFSTEVKNYLSLIPIYGSDNIIVSFVLPKYAITFISDLLHDYIDLDNLNNVTQIRESLLAIKKSSGFNRIDLAILDKLIETIDNFIGEEIEDQETGELISKPIPTTIS